MWNSVLSKEKEKRNFEDCMREYVCLERVIVVIGVVVDIVGYFNGLPNVLKSSFSVSVIIKYDLITSVVTFGIITLQSSVTIFVFAGIT